MNVLAICSALNKSYLAFKYNDKYYSKIIQSDKNYHSLYLVSEIKKIIQTESIDLSNLDFLTVNCGPGSFTGIRVAITIAKVIAGELDKLIVPLNTAEILLEAFNADVLVMDARRDMFFVGDKNKIEIINKDKIEDKIKNKKVLTDKRCCEISNNLICFEEENVDIGRYMIELAINKYDSSSLKDEFHYMKLSPNYIQTPPVF